MSFDYEGYYEGLRELKALQAGVSVVPCEIPWCVLPAEWEWIRTPEQLKRMRVKVKGSIVDAAPVKQVCERHRREGLPYVPLGSTGIVDLPPPEPKRRKARTCPHCGGVL